MNLLAGGLTKLEIVSGTKGTLIDGKFKADPGGGKSSYMAMINPNSYKMSYSSGGNCEKEKQFVFADGTKVQSKIIEFTSSLSFDIIIDGTGVIPAINNQKIDGKYVTNQIKLFHKTVVEYKSEKHATNPVTVVWGDLIFKGQLSSLDVDYTLFDRQGHVLRAKLSCSFDGFEDWKTKKKNMDPKSPDLTHMRIVKQGDTLPLLCHEIYEDSSLYLQVAKSNRITNIMKLHPGQKIYFPPLKVG